MERESTNRKDFTIKIVACLCALLLAVTAGVRFYEHRHYQETVVVSDSYTDKKMLSDYVPSLKGTMVDTPVFFFDSGVPGGTILYLGGTHPYEPAASLSAFIMMENIHVTKGRVIVIPQANRSATTLGMLGNAYPQFYSIKTSWGSAKYKIGDRWANPLDSWPDPFTYRHYPSGLQLTYQDLRNINRCYPGRENGAPLERACYAIMQIIRNEKVDMAIDSHEAAVMYPVVETYVAHERALDIAMMAAMNLSASQFYMKCEASPKNLRGLSHREWGDFSDTLAVLMETPQPFTDWIVGPMTEELQTIGADEFLGTAMEHGLTYVEYDKNVGCPMKLRVGRHLSGAAEVINWMNMSFPEKEVLLELPSYNDLMENDCGYYLHNPEEADASKIFKF
ncbi:MAG: succinylglutamate desuccinylase [Eubacteriales bacterium]|nr:succinylglutamate desuccinylase [Eubacteriales bacterium]